MYFNILGRKFRIIVILGALAPMTATFSCGERTVKARPIHQNITESVYASGYVKSVDQYEVYPNVSGIIHEIYVKEGDIVRKDQPLMTLVNETPRLSEENARLSAAYAASAANKDKLRELRAEVELANAKLQNDSTLLEKQKHLWLQQIGSRNDLDQRNLTFENSKTAYYSAMLRYHDLEKQDNFLARQSQKSLEISSRQLHDYTIQSKISGKVYSVSKQPGEMVNVQTPVAIVGRDKDFLLELQVDEYDIRSIREGQKVMLSMDSYKGQTFEAVIQKIYPLMNDRSRTFQVEAAFVRAPAALYPNLTIEANIIIQVKQDALVVPRNFLIGDTAVRLQDKSYRKVVVGIRDYKNAEILEGLTGDDIILKPAQ